MNAALVELCNLIADQGADYAHKNQGLFLEIIRQETGRAVREDQATFVFKVFSFLNWAYSNGVWSNLSNTSLRRDLMSQSLKSIVLRTAHELAQDKSAHGVAHLAAELDEEFRMFGMLYNQRLQELTKQGFEPNANVATLCGLEWIQERLAIRDDDMELILPRFNSRAGNIAEIEDLANQVTRAAHNRGKVRAVSTGCSTFLAILAGILSLLVVLI